MTRTPVSTVLEGKPVAVFTTDRRATVTSAVREMIRQKVGSLIVTDRGRVCGIVTERDFMRHMALPDYTPGRNLVQEIMTTEVVCVEPQTDLGECMALMTRQRCRHLPVMKGGALVGLVSIGDLVRCASAEQKAEIHFLTEYIMGTYPGTETSALAVFARERSAETVAV